MYPDKDVSSTFDYLSKRLRTSFKSGPMCNSFLWKYLSKIILVWVSDVAILTLHFSRHHRYCSDQIRHHDFRPVRGTLWDMLSQRLFSLHVYNQARRMTLKCKKCCSLIVYITTKSTPITSRLLQVQCQWWYASFVIRSVASTTSNLPLVLWKLQSKYRVWSFYE